jgi:hypothetical protein
VYDTTSTIKVNTTHEDELITARSIHDNSIVDEMIILPKKLSFIDSTPKPRMSNLKSVNNSNTRNN